MANGISLSGMWSAISPFWMRTTKPRMGAWLWRRNCNRPSITSPSDGSGCWVTTKLLGDDEAQPARRAIHDLVLMPADDQIGPLWMGKLEAIQFAFFLRCRRRGHGDRDPGDG